MASANFNRLSATLLASLQPIKHFPLFYPCSGNDLIEPITTFAPHIHEFWFVDIGYFEREIAENVQPVLNANKDYTLLDVAFRFANIAESEWREDIKYAVSPPIIRTESYQHIPSGETVTIHRHRRTGPSALQTEIDKMSIFFYRGDSDEGGSGTHWLTIRKWAEPKEQERIMRDGALIFDVLDKLVDGGLLVTDGSMCKGENNPYRELRRFHPGHTIGARAVEEAKSFIDLMGRTFQCIGYAGERKGPTLIWQVSKPQHEGENKNG